jgi:hypothetical protein
VGAAVVARWESNLPIVTCYLAASMTKATPASRLRDLYGFDFPDDLFAFHDFARRHPDLEETLHFRLSGPFDVLDGKTKKGSDPISASRAHLDLPEFVAVACGETDGLRWGYWFDEPPTSKPFVVSYFTNDAFQFSVDGTTLFDALRKHVEQSHRDAEEYLADEPDEPSHARDLDRYAVLREEITAYGGPNAKTKGLAYLEGLSRKKIPSASARKPIETRHGLGVVVPKGTYVPLTKPERWSTWNYVPKATEVKRDVARAISLAEEGSPGTALKLGHDLWAYPDFATESRSMLALAYEELDRPLLRTWLDRAEASKKSDQKTSRR